MASALLDHHEVRSGLELLSVWIEGHVACRGLSFAVVHDHGANYVMPIAEW
jgi:hypothetical protein